MAGGGGGGVSVCVSEVRVCVCVCVCVCEVRVCVCVCETFKKNYIHCIFVNFSENWRSLMLRYAHNYELLYLHTHTHSIFIQPESSTG